MPPEKIPYAIERYTDEVNRLFGVMNARLADHEYLAGPYSIADMASVGWVRYGGAWDSSSTTFPISSAGSTPCWRARPSRRAWRSTIPGGRKIDLATDEEARRVLFGQRAR